MLTQVIADPSKKKWLKETEQLRTIYLKNKASFTAVSLEMILKILQITNEKKLDELLSIFLQMYQVIATIAEQ